MSEVQVGMQLTLHISLPVRMARPLVLKGEVVRVDDRADVGGMFKAAAVRWLQTARKLVQTDLQRRRITPLQASDTLDHLRPMTDYSGLKNADIVIEAIVEKLPVKQQVFRDLAEATSPRTVLATNTSSLLVRDIAEGVPHPERVVGLHFFNPPHQMPLVEIVQTEQTSPAAVAASASA